jgi:hypothetical protein
MNDECSNRGGVSVESRIAPVSLHHFRQSSTVIQQYACDVDAREQEEQTEVRTKILRRK